MSSTSSGESRSAPVAVWSVLEKMSPEELVEWRVKEVEGRPSIEDRNLDLPHPFGWFVACYSDELAVGEVKPLRYFDRDLVLWRGEDGVPRMLDAYCKHLGAHMGHGGRVQGNMLECPFHAWKYDEQGIVQEIPYSKTIPPKLKRPCDNQWHVVERNRFIWFWYHPHGVAPRWDVEELPETVNPDWTEYETCEWYVYGSIQNMAENGVDFAHFKYIHGTHSFPEAKLKWDDHRRSATVEAKMMTPKGEMDGQISYVTVGPGQAWTRFTGISETLMVSGVTPVAQDKVHVRFAFTQPKEQVDGPMGGLARAMIKDICKQLDQDKVVWDRQRYLPNPQICAGDGPIAQFRKYYTQFYAEWDDDPASDNVTPMVNRK